MILKAARDYNIDLTESFMVGDSENDIKAGIAAGCKSILIDNEKNNNDKDYGQIDTLSSIMQFVLTYLK